MGSKNKFVLSILLNGWMTMNNVDDKELPDFAHVVRYVKPTMVFEDGSVHASAFRLRSNDAGLSVNWLECFGNCTKSQQLNQVRRLSRLTMSRNGRFAELNVGETKQYIRYECRDMRFAHAPLVATEKYEADPSHSEILGLPSGDSVQVALVSQLIAECVKAVHPAVTGGGSG